MIREVRYLLNEDRGKVYSSLRRSWKAGSSYGESQTQGRDIALSKLAQHSGRFLFFDIIYQTGKKMESEAQP